MNKESLHTVSDDLLYKISAGDASAFRELFDMRWDAVYSVALAFTKSPMLSEELVQDIFVKIWLNRSALTEVRNFESYLFIIARNHIYNSLRIKVREIPFIKELEQHFAENSSSDDLTLLHETEMMIRKAVESLPGQQRAVFQFSRFEGLNQDQIASRMGISRLTVKVHMKKALQNLRIYLKQYSGGLLLFTIIIIR